jgi:hypothetical protein
MTAMKVRVSDIVNGKWEKKEGMVPSFVVSQDGEEISRARIMGTIVGRFIADDGNFASLTLDDGTETIRMKTFKTTKPLDGFDVGNVVDAIGKIREYMGEIYMIPEIVTKIDNPNMELLRKLELIKGIGKSSGTTKDSVKGTGNKIDDKDENPDSSKGRISGTDKKDVKRKESGNDRAELKREILKFIESGEDGMEYSKILEKMKDRNDNEIESVVNEVLAEGICYEPTPGKIKKI